MPAFRTRLARDRRKPNGFIRPCAPTLSEKPPTGPNWIHEIKHDGYRILAVREGASIRLWSRHGLDWSDAFRSIADALLALRVSSLVIDGEAVTHCPEGLPDYHGLRSKDGGARACLYAFDLLQVDGEDLRCLPLIERRARLAKLLKTAGPALIMSEHLEGDGPTIFRHACDLGLEGIVSKRKDGPYRTGRSAQWLKIKNPAYRRRREPIELPRLALSGPARQPKQQRPPTGGPENRAP